MDLSRLFPKVQSNMIVRSAMDIMAALFGAYG